MKTNHALRPANLLLALLPIVPVLFAIPFLTYGQGSPGASLILLFLTGVATWRLLHGDIQWFKELRSQATVWVAGLVVCLVPILLWCFQDDPVMTVLKQNAPSGLGIVALFLSVAIAAGIMGHEFNCRTADTLYASGSSRSRIWWLKMGAALFQSITILAAATLTMRMASFDRHAPPDAVTTNLLSPELLPILAALMAAWLGAGWHAIRARGTLAGAILSIGSVSTVAIGLAAIQSLRSVWLKPLPAPDIPAASVVLAYLALAAWSAWRSHTAFCSYESTGTNALQFSGAGKWPLGHNLHRLPGLSPWLGNELRLHWPAIGTCLIMTVLALVGAMSFALRPGGGESVQRHWILLPIILLAPVSALLAGAIAISDERNLGTWDWQRSQGRSLLRLWGGKLLVSGLVALTCSILVPSAIYGVLGHALGFPSWIDFIGTEFFVTRNFPALLRSHGIILSACMTLLFALAFLGSSVMSDTIHSVAMTVVAAAVVIFFASIAYETSFSRSMSMSKAQFSHSVATMTTEKALDLREQLLARRILLPTDNNSHRALVAYTTGSCLLVVSILGCSFLNLRHTRRPWLRVISQIFAISVALCTTVIFLKGSDSQFDMYVQRKLFNTWEERHLKMLGDSIDYDLFVLFGVPSSTNYLQLAVEAFPLAGGGTTTADRVRTESAKLTMENILSTMSRPLTERDMNEPIGRRRNHPGVSPDRVRYISLPSTPIDRKWILDNVVLPDSIAEVLRLGLDPLKQPPAERDANPKP